MLKNFKIRTKILGLVGFFMLNLIGVVFLATSAMKKVGMEMQKVIDTDIPLVQIASKITELQLQQEIAYERGLRFLEQGNTRRFAVSRKQFEILDRDIETEIEKAENMIQSALNDDEQSGMHGEFEKLNTRLMQLKKDHLAFSGDVQTAVGLFQAGNEGAAAAMESRIEEKEKALMREVEEFLHAVTELSADTLKAVKSEEDQILVVLSSIGTIMVVVSLAIALLINRSVSGRLGGVVRQIHAIASENNLTIRMDSDGRDEISSMSGELNGFLDKIDGILKELSSRAENMANSSQLLNEASQSFSTGSEELSQQSQSISSAATEMDQNLIVVAGAVEEMTTSIAEVTQQAVDAASVASQANETAEGTASLVTELGQNAEAIGVVTDTISQIADQTNLLALNAAIEAAGAGEAGKGFAVVASEVKELARQASEAAEDIKTRILTVQRNTDQTVSAIQTITEIISRLNEINSAIASAMEEQSITTREISANVTQSSQAASEVSSSITNISEVSSASAQDANKTFQMAQALQDISKRLDDIVHQFKLEK